MSCGAGGLLMRIHSSPAGIPATSNPTMRPATNCRFIIRISRMSRFTREADGPVTAVLKFRNGVERQASIVPGNRVLYVEGHFGRTEKLDLASMTRIDFE